MPTADVAHPEKDKERRLPDFLRDVEKAIDAGVKKALARSKLPKREEVEALRARAAALSTRLEALTSKRRSAR